LFSNIIFCLYFLFSLNFCFPFLLDLIHSFFCRHMFSKCTWTVKGACIKWENYSGKLRVLIWIFQISVMYFVFWKGNLHFPLLLPISYVIIVLFTNWTIVKLVSQQEYQILNHVIWWVKNFGCWTLVVCMCKWAGGSFTWFGIPLDSLGQSLFPDFLIEKLVIIIRF
jgi:hypothetical protein